MDAFAITGVSPDQQWFRVEGAVGGVDAPARLYPRTQVVDTDEIAGLAAGGRTIYVSRGTPDAPLVPLAPEDAARFDPALLPVGELPQFAFLEHANDQDIDALLALRMGEDVADAGLRLRRLEALGWITGAADGRIELTPVGLELLRHWLI